MRPLLLTLALFVGTVTPTHAAPPVVPIILVKGYGPHFAQLLRYQKFFAQDGIGHVYAVDYDHKASIPTIERQLSASFASILRRYPAGTQFDLITHSLGGFVGLYTAMRSPWAKQLRKYVSLAGMTRGQNSLPRICRWANCGWAVTTLTPFMNSFLRNFYSLHSTALEKIDKCALYSYSDRIMSDPPESGVLPGSKAIEVSGAGHLDFIWRRDIYDIMRTACYGAPYRGSSYRWTMR